MLRLANDLDISREAAARRYVELHHETLAAVFCLNGKFIYAHRTDEFPALSVKKNQMVTLPGDPRDGRLSSFEDVDSANWVDPRQKARLAAQTLFQRDGFSTTLLHAFDEETDDELDDTYERFSRLERR